ncbi:MAG TPA: hypothetical protein VKV15_21680 [Bryobacteraceae bacterium]|nr:hypothetical protein [Bryobacteraceae bacterium]
MLILDTHVHIYSEDDRRYPPKPNPYRPPGSNGSLANLERVTKASGSGPPPYAHLARMSRIRRG